VRVAITGPPKSGKTTLAAKLSDNYLSTDTLAHLGWSESSEAASLWFNKPGDLVIEGVAVPRALRKWLRENEGMPIDTLIIFTRSHVKLSMGQHAMAKGVVSVLRQIIPTLRSRGVVIKRGSHEV